MTAPGPAPDRDREDYDRQRAEYEAHERTSLAQRRCPDSGNLLFPREDGRLHCIAACDCFGYTLEEYQAKGGRPWRGTR